MQRASSSMAPMGLPVPPKASKTTDQNVSIIAILFTLELLAGILPFWAFLRKYSKYRDMARTFGLELLPAGGPKWFSYAELKAATNNSYDDRMHFELVERMVKTAIWCLQDRAEMRPSMGKVAKMLEGTVEITEPVRPTIFCVSEE